MIPNSNDNSKPSVLASVKIVTVEWFLSSTAHALPNIFRTSSIALKVLWLLCFLASGSYCVYSIVKSLQDFLSYPTFISTSLIQEIPTEFPSVTVCNMKRINQTASKEHFRNRRYGTFNETPNLQLMPYRNIIGQQYITRTQFLNDGNLTDADRRRMGYQLDEMLLSCVYNLEPCSSKDFVYFYDPFYGNCYTFNRGHDQNGTKVPLKTSTIPGRMHGLVLEFFIGEPNVETMSTCSDGIAVSIHNSSAIPFTNDVAILAASNADTDIMVSRNFISKLEYPYGDCLKNIKRDSAFSSYYFDYIVRSTGMMYSNNYCFMLCLQKSTMDKCNCTNSFLPTFKGDNRFCSTAGDIACVVGINDYLLQNASMHCKHSCPLECDSVEYETVSHKSFYPTKYYKKLLSYFPIIKNSNISMDDLGEAVAKVNIYYKSFLHRSTVQMVQTNTESFFSNIGGTLGLYLGISLLSLVEVVELGFNLVMTLISLTKKAKTITTTIDATAAATVD